MQAWAQAALRRLPAPQVPATEEWSVSVKEVVRCSCDIPSVAAKALGLLDRFGSARISGSHVGFDSTDVSWENIIEIKTAPLLEVANSAALEREVERLRAALPPIPGRRWVMGRVLQLLQVMIAQAGFGDSTIRTPATVSGVVYRGRLNRTREASPGLLAALLLATSPRAMESLVATAAAHGHVVALPEEPDEEHVRRLRADQLAQQVDRFTDIAET